MVPGSICLNGNDWQIKGYLGEDWLWRNAHQPVTRDTRFWIPALVPGSVQHDLWMAGEIPDPYFERNSLLIEWIPQRTWVYRKTFRVHEVASGTRVQLRFEGVDYAARFYLNGEFLGRHQGMFTPAVFEVTYLLNRTGENLLAVVLDPAPVEQPQVGDTSQVRTHKTRMNYWWDFCPRMVHLGIWDGVGLELSGPARIDVAHIRTVLTDDLKQAQGRVSVRIDSTIAGPAVLSADIQLDGKPVVTLSQAVLLNLGDTKTELEFQINDPQVWWPNGAGDTPIYSCSIRIAMDGEENIGISHKRDISFGVRQITFEPNEGANPTAQPFVPVVNGRRLYIQGWNWVPFDVLYGVERYARLEQLLELARRAGVNLLRVWGGGLIEKESFYDLCDQKGLMVWQEFIQSSSGIENQPPDDPQHIEFMVDQARQIIPRRRNHPSLVIWCGGNELQSGPDTPCDRQQPLLSALGQVVGDLDPDRLWLPTSPSGGVFMNNLENLANHPEQLHDVHGPWEFQGVEGQYTLYNQGTARLNSEFGVEGITNRRTLEKVISAEQRWPATLDNPAWFHLGAWWVKEQSWRQVFGKLPDYERGLRAVQLMQAEGLKYAVEANRRRAFQNAGSLPWQFNEPYPMAACTSAVDYYARPKPAYYAVRTAYAPFAVTARFDRMAWVGFDDFEAEIWLACSSPVEMYPACLEAQIVSASGRVLAGFDWVIPRMQDLPGMVGKVSLPIAMMEEEVFFLDLVLEDRAGLAIGENRYVFTTGSDLSALFDVPRTYLEAVILDFGNTWKAKLCNKGSSTALYAWLEDGWDQQSPGYACFDADHFCLFPGETRMVEIDFRNVPISERVILVSGWNFPPLILE